MRVLLGMAADASWIDEILAESCEFAGRVCGKASFYGQGARSEDAIIQVAHRVLPRRRIFLELVARLAQGLLLRGKGAVAEKVCAFRGFDVGRFSEVGQWTSR